MILLLYIIADYSNGWDGPNRPKKTSVLVRARAWRSSSFPKPDFHSSGDPIIAGLNIYNVSEPKYVYEKSHNFKEYPSFVVVRIKLNDTADGFDGFYSDAEGASHLADEYSYLNGFVIYGFDTTVFRVWTDTSTFGALVNFGGRPFDSFIKHGDLELMARKSTSLQQDLEQRVQLGAIPGFNFEMETNFRLTTNTDTDSIVGFVWAEALDGDNKGFRFPATGGLLYTPSQECSPCCYGGLTYAYTNTTLRLWKPKIVEFGKVICIGDQYAWGNYSQGSNNASALLQIWTVSKTGYACNNDEECSDASSKCMNKTCQCKSGFFESLSECHKELTCLDTVPVIPEIELRQRINIVSSDIIFQNHVDDSYIVESWYTGLYSDEQWLMPDSQSVPIEGGCGSMNPVYIKGIHPSSDALTEDGIEVEVQTLNDINTTYTIKIRKCGQSVQYRLNPVMLQSFVFCIDSPLIQAHNNFEKAPTDVNIGMLSIRVDLRYDIQDIRGGKHYQPYLVFQCESDEVDTTTYHVYFTTYWFINGNLLRAVGPSESISELTEQDLLDRSVKLGFDISCGVQLSTTKRGYITIMVESNIFYAGIKFQRNSLEFRRGEFGSVAFQPTIPIGCVYNDFQHGECSKGVFLKPQEGSGGDSLVAVQTQPTCGTRMKTLKEGDNMEAQWYEINITSIDNNYNDRYVLRLQLITDGLGHRIWRSYQLQDIEVLVTYNDATKHKLCYSHVDPHQRTADGYLYEHQYEGEYTLYRNTKYPVKVQMKTTLCNRGKAYCACAVAIRAGGDVFVINLCAGSKFIGYTSCTDNGILVVKRYNQFRYKVSTPIGTYIDILIRPTPNYYDLMNIDIYMAPKDIQSTEGLCGYFDNNKTNDLRKRESSDFYTIYFTRGRHVHAHFSNEWRIQNPDINYLKIDNPMPVPRWGTTNFCSCSQTNDEEPMAVCSPSLPKGFHKQDNFNTIKCLTIESQSELRERQRRSALFTMDASSNKNNIRKKRDISEAEADTVCKDAILNHSAVNDFKHRLVDIDITDVIQECAFDVSAEDDESWADVYPDSLIHIIETYNEKDPAYMAEHEEEIIKFISMSCLMNCSGNGVCSVNGNCECEDGFFGPDCSLDKAKPLTIDDIYGDGVCDMSDGNSCNCFAIQTIGLFDEFVCNVTKTEDSAAVFITQYVVSISNDASTFGNSSTTTVFDSTCQDISMFDTQQATLKNNTCFIGGQCIAENGTDDQRDCLLCVPNVNRYKWTSNCKTSDESSSILLLVVIPSGIFGIGVVIIIASAFVGYCRRSKRHTPPTAENRRQPNFDSAF